MMFILLQAFFWSEPVRLDPSSFYSQASQAFARGEGRALEREATQFGLAAKAVGPRVDTLQLVLEPETRLNGTESAESLLGLGLEMSLANLPRLQRDALLAEGRAASSQRELQRQIFMLDAMGAFATTLRAQGRLAHARSWYERALNHEKALQQSETAALVSKLEWIEQRSFTGQLSDELRQAQADVALAQTQLASLFAAPVETSAANPDALLSQANPYRTLLAKLPLLPEQRYFQAAAEASEKAAALAHAASAPRLGLQLQHRGQGDNAWLGASLQVSWSTQPRRGPEWFRHQAAADAGALRADQRGKALDQELRQRAEAFDQQQARAQSFVTDVLEPQQQREAILAQAYQQGLVSRRLWLDAQQDQHEAEHQYLTLTYDIWEAATLAALLTRLSEETP